MDIKITVGTTELEAEIYDTELGRKIAGLLPLEASPNRWGEEIYFGMPLDHDLQKEQEEVEVGELAFWPPGKGFCIFYGPTPASEGNKPKAASEVEVFGRVKGDATVLKKESGNSVQVEKA